MPDNLGRLRLRRQRRTARGHRELGRHGGGAPARREGQPARHHARCRHQHDDRHRELAAGARPQRRPPPRTATGRWPISTWTRSGQKCDGTLCIAPQRGMSLVELLVATVISLLGVLIIFQVFAVNEDVRRTTTSGSDEQTSGLMALMSLERDLRHAGFGINDFALVGCNMKMYDAHALRPTTMPARLSRWRPCRSSPTPASIPDVIRVIYGGSKQTTAAVQLGSDMETATDPVSLVSRFGFDPGDVVVVGQPGAQLHDDGGDRLVRPGGSGARLRHLYVIPQTGQSKIPRFNNPAGLPELYKFLLGAKVLNLGVRSPVRDEITVRNDRGQPARQQQAGGAEHLGQQIASPPAGRRADRPAQGRVRHGRRQEQRHGRPRASTRPTTAWWTTSPRSARTRDKPEEWTRVRSVRVAIVSRSLTPDRPPCNATPALQRRSPRTTPIRCAGRAARTRRRDGPSMCAPRRLAVLPLPRLRDHGTAAQHDLEAGMKALRNRMRLPLAPPRPARCRAVHRADRAGGHEPGRHRDHALGGHRQPDLGQRRLQAGHAVGGRPRHRRGVQVPQGQRADHASSRRTQPSDGFFAAASDPPNNDWSDTSVWGRRQGGGNGRRRQHHSAT